jgi:hypothetical protein
MISICCNSAVRHAIWVENRLQHFIPSRTGRNLSLRLSSYPHQIPDGILDDNDLSHNQRADRHIIWVENDLTFDVPSHTGRDVDPLFVFYPYSIPDRILDDNDLSNYLSHNQRAYRHEIWVENYMQHNQRADRHIIWAENVLKFDVPSRTGRDTDPFFVFYPYSIPDGILAKTMSENFKAVVI